MKYISKTNGYHKVFIDTSAWLAYVLKGEQRHTAVRDLLRSIRQQRVLLFTSNDVVDEAVTRLVYTTNPSAVKKFIQLITQSFLERSVVQLWADDQTQREALDLVEKYSDQRLSLTDATSAVHIKRFAIDVVVSLDNDFRKIGIRTLPQ